MSHPHEPVPVKLISSLFSPEKALLEGAITEMTGVYGALDWISSELYFDRTTYYAREMGWPLHRRFVAFTNLIPPDQLPEIKLQTNALEQRYLSGQNRTVNIDPGYISPERLILATGKNYVHRVYLAKGIYADLTLVFRRKSFRTLQWTYPDYADSQIIGCFNRMREIYMQQLREMKRLD
jgi:hypothetical protein